MPRGSLTVNATFVEITEDSNLLTFTDVSAARTTMTQCIEP